MISKQRIESTAVRYTRSLHIQHLQNARHYTIKPAGLSIHQCWDRPRRIKKYSSFSPTTIRILKEQGEASLPNICASFKIKMLNPAEISYLSEYCIVTKPVSMALNILQSETNTQMGWLLPTIYLLESKLKKIETSVKVCFPLFMLSGKVYKSASGSSWKIQNSLVLQFFFQNSKRHGQTRPTS